MPVLEPEDQPEQTPPAPHDPKRWWLVYHACGMGVLYEADAAATLDAVKEKFTSQGCVEKSCGKPEGTWVIESWVPAQKGE